MNLRIFDTVDDLIHAAAKTLLQRIDAGARTIGLSGGSTPRPLYENLGRNDELREKPMTWVIIDERYVPIDDPQSNAGMIRKSLFARGKPESHRFLQFKTELGDPARTADEFEREWRDFKLVHLDIAILGVGDDGHTASLFPGTEVLTVEDHIAAAVYVPEMNSWRVTLTKPVLRAAGLRIVLAAGASKRAVMQEVRAGAEFPIALVSSGVETWWFLDRAAAGE